MPTSPRKPRNPMAGESPKTQITPGGTAETDSEQRPAPGREAGSERRPLPAPRPVDAPDTDRYMAGEESAACDACDVSFTASDDVDADPDEQTRDNDGTKDTDEGTDGDPVLA